MRLKRKVFVMFTASVVLIAGAAVVAGLGDQGWVHKAGVRAFGPPAVTMAEVYPDAPATQADRFDHSVFDQILKVHVDADGWVDYKALSEDTDPLDAYIAALADAPFEAMSRDEKLALMINAYNAFTLRLILDHYPTQSIMDIPEDQRWDHARWVLAGETLSLNQLEHERIRKDFVEPRIHFALVCAAYSCPPLRHEAFTADRLEAQLADQTEYSHTHDRWLRYDRASNTLHLTSLYDWYGGDFEAVADSVLEYVARQSPAVRAAVDGGNPPRIRWIDYSWKLNDITQAP